MAVAIASMSMLCPKPSNCPNITTQCHHPKQNPVKPLPCLSLDDSKKRTAISKSISVCAVLASLSCCDASLAAQAQQAAAQGDSRGMLFLAPVVPAVLWALLNIYEPAKNQIRRMRSR